MKTKIFILAVILFSFKVAVCQDINEEKNRYIEVTGSAEMEVQT